MLRSRVGGPPGPFWIPWTGTLINRTATLVRPFLVLYLAGAEHMSLTSAGAVLSVTGFGSLAVAELVDSRPSRRDLSDARHALATARNRHPGPPHLART